MGRSRAPRRRRRTIATDKAGYLQTIDYAGLAAWCAERDCQLMLRADAGDFVLRRMGLFTVFGADDAAIESGIEGLQACVITGPLRTPVQDPAFPITQLNQLVARALSPGINDPGTAITCIDWFSLSLSPIIDRDLPGCVFVDAKGTPRVLARCPDFGQLMSTIHAPLREMGSGQVAVAARLFDSLAWLAELTLRPQRLRILELQGDRLWARLAAADLPDDDRQYLARRHRRLLALTRRRARTGRLARPASPADPARRLGATATGASSAPALTPPRGASPDR